MIWNRGSTNTTISETRFSAAERRPARRRSRPAGTGTAGSPCSPCRTGRCSCSPRHGRASTPSRRRSREELDPASGHALGRRRRGGVGRHRRDADEGRPAGHGVAGHRRRRRAAGLDPAERLRGRHGRVVPRDRCRDRRRRAGRRDERRARRRLRPADPSRPGPAGPDAASREGLERSSSSGGSARLESSSRTPTARRCASPATAAARRRSRAART